MLRRRWLWAWLAMLGMSVLLTIVSETTGNRALVPGILFYGAAAGPVALLVATHDRTGIGAAVPAWVLLWWMVLLAGGLALAVAGFFDAVLIGKLEWPDILRVGFIEEPAKLIGPAAMALTGRYLTKPAGIAMGLATATSFSVLESMAYGLRYVKDSVLQADMVLLSRDLLTPFGHLAWTGLFCAVAFGVWQRRGRVVVTPLVIGALATSIALHSLFDSVMTIPGWSVWLRLLCYLAVLVASYWLFHRATRTVVARP